MNNKSNKSKIRFCWECGRKLWGNHYAKVDIHGCMRILHKQCAKELDKEDSYIWKDWYADLDEDYEIQ